MLIIRQAKIEELNQVILFYYDLIDDMQDAKYKPGWEKGVYPTQVFIQESIEKQTLYIGLLEGKIVSAMMINHEFVDGYKNAPWKVNAKVDEFMVIHALGISPFHQGKGIAKQMILHTVDVCSNQNMKAIRLDVLTTNLSAIRLYETMGFYYVDTIKIFYEDVGLSEFHLYEYKLE